LKDNNVLSEIDLGCNGIGTAGVTALVEGLKVNTSLTELRLSNNDLIDNDSARVLAAGLAQNIPLKELDLSDNAQVEMVNIAHIRTQY
jgi:Ran GTPase-activating protein (RanGAP) involved in mRNA processing and transport